MKLSTSILNSQDRIKTITDLNDTQTDYIHIDVMDNIFVPNKQFTIEEINNIIKITKKPLDIHLMTINPEYYIKNIDKLNIEYITIHAEINQNIENIIKLIKTYNIKVGLAINPNTNVKSIEKYIDSIDMILVMSVEPGKGGQQFIPNTINKINEIKNKYKNKVIEVDGGIKDSNIDQIKNDINIAVVGSFITNSNNYNEAINKIKN